MKSVENLNELDLIIGNEGRNRVSLYALKEFENAASEKSSFKIKQNNKYYLSRFLYQFWLKFLKRKKLAAGFVSVLGLFFSSRNLFTIFMGSRFPKIFPYIFRKGYKAIYLFDAWPVTHAFIARFVRDFKINHLFVSSSQATEMLNKILDNEICFWLPEGIDANDYRFYQPEKKDIEVVAIGRKFDLYHDLIVAPLLQKQINYVFSTAEKMAFTDHSDLIEGLARSKISICFPANSTHPERTGGIETMTHRYLQSMASKCLVLGKAPEEMIVLFGYNPVIEVDMNNPDKQVIEILSNFEKYTELIERNYEMVVRNHTWENRWESISTIISIKINEENEK